MYTHLRYIRKAWKRTQIILICYNGTTVVGTIQDRQFLTQTAPSLSNVEREVTK